MSDTRVTPQDAPPAAQPPGEALRRLTVLAMRRWQLRVPCFGLLGGLTGYVEAGGELLDSVPASWLPGPPRRAPPMMCAGSSGP